MSVTISVGTVFTAIRAVAEIVNRRIQIKMISNIDKKIDSLIIRELVAANTMLDDIKATGDFNEKDLSYLKGLYHKNTGLPTDGITAGIENSKIVLMSYLGIMQIAVLQGESEQRILRYILHIFELGEKAAALELFPDFYQDVFAHYCRKIDIDYQKRIANWKNEKKLILEYVATTTVLGGVVTLNPIIPVLGVPFTYSSEAAKSYVISQLNEKCMQKKMLVVKQKASMMLSQSI